MTQGAEMLPVEQSDRDEAKAMGKIFSSQFAQHGFHLSFSVSDDGPLVQAFARHRLRTHPAATGTVRVVPVEPTREMSDAGRDATGGCPYAPHDIPKLGYMQVAIIWSAMIAAAPKAADTAIAAGEVTSLTMRNGDVLRVGYPGSPDWAKSWDIGYPPDGKIGTTNEQDDELVQRYGLTALFNAYREALAQQESTHDQ